MIVTCCTLNNIGYDDPCSALRDFIINTDTGHMMSMLYIMGIKYVFHSLRVLLRTALTDHLHFQRFYGTKEAKLM